MSIRLRLTLTYTIILALTLVVFGAVLYANQARVTLEFEKQDLLQTAQRIVRARQPFAPRFWSKQPDTFGVLYVQARDAQGEEILFADTPEDVVLPLTTRATAEVAKGRGIIEVVNVNGQRLLLYSRPLGPGIQRSDILQIARTLTVRDQSMAALARWLWMSGLAATVGAFGIGWVMAGMALKPIHRLTATAQSIGAHRDFSRRVKYAGPQDEVGKLATTFNAMLDELQVAHHQVEEALKLQRRFVADVSHELRTPLTTLYGNIQLLRREPPIGVEDQAEVLEDLASESQRLIRLVNDLLALARADAHRSLAVEPVQIAPLVEEVCRQARLLDPDRTISFGPLPSASVLCNADALKQVLLAILDNALKHTAGGIMVEASMSDEQLTIHVHDTGPGIDSRLFPHIFERFVRGEEAHGTTGTGLGLAIAKTLTEAQGGSISVESHAGEGTTVSVTLPCVEDGRV